MTAKPPASPPLTPAVDRLLDLACETRPDLDRQDLHGAITAARTAGWSWERVLVAVAGMLARGEEPRDIRNAAATVVRRRNVTTTT